MVLFRESNLLQVVVKMGSFDFGHLACGVTHGFGLDLSTTAEIMLGASSHNVLPGLECVGPLKVTDTVCTTKLDISKGYINLPTGPGLGLKLDENKLEKYRFDV